MSFAMFASVAAGYLAGLVASWFVAKYIVAWAIVRGGPRDARGRRVVLRLGAAGAFVGLAPALLLGIVVGGTLGGAWGEMASMALGAGKAGIVPGIAIGMFLVVVAVMGLSVAIGAALGRFLARNYNEGVGDDARRPADDASP